LSPSSCLRHVGEAVLLKPCWQQSRRLQTASSGSFQAWEISSCLRKALRAGLLRKLYIILFIFSYPYGPWFPMVPGSLWSLDPYPYGSWIPMVPGCLWSLDPYCPKGPNTLWGPRRRHRQIRILSNKYGY